MTINTNLVCELQNAVKVQYLDGNLFSQDVQGNVINVTVLDGGEPATLSGSVSANIIRADGGTVAATGGTFAGNVASITLPAAAYSVPGVVSIVVKITDSGVTTTIAAVVANIYQSSTDTVVDPGTIIPSIQTLIAAIDAAVASIPADYSSLWSSLAPNYSIIGFPVYTGYLCTYDGVLYRAKCDIPTSETWNSSHWAQVNIGDYIHETKSAFNHSLSVAGENLLSISDFDTPTDSNVTFSVSGGKITITNGSSANYAGLLTSSAFLAKLATGRMYRFHARCSIDTGNGTPVIAAKAGNNYVNAIYIGVSASTVVDFVVDSNTSAIALMVAFGSSTSGSVVSFDELWVKEMGKDTVARNDIIDLKSALLSEETFADWKVCGINPAYGTETTNAARLSLTKYVGINQNVASVRSLTGYEFSVFAWNNSTGAYVGMYTTGNVFATSGTAKWMGSFNFAAYPAYKFKVVLRNAVTTTAEMSVSDGLNGVFAVCRYDTDETMTKENVAADAAKVGVIKNAFILTDKLSCGAIDILWEQGGLYVGDGTEYNSPKNIRTPMLTVTSGKTIYIYGFDTNVYTLYAHEYNSPSSYKGATQILTNNFTPTTNYIRFRVAKLSDENILPSEVPMVFYYRNEGFIYEDVLNYIVMTEEIATSEYSNLASNIPGNTFCYINGSWFTDISETGLIWLYTYSYGKTFTTFGYQRIVKLSTFTEQIRYKYVSNDSWVWTGWQPLVYPSTRTYYEMDSGDLDDIAENSIYGLSSEKTYTHCPVTAGYVETYIYNKTLDFRTQRCTDYFKGDVYYRYKTSSWSAWKQINSKQVYTTQKKYIAIGDSITYGQTSDGTTRASVPYPTIVGSQLGLTVENDGVGGMGFLNRAYAGGVVFYEKVQTVDFTNACLVTIAGGINDTAYSLGTHSDASGAATICGQIKACIDWILSHSNNYLQIIVISPMRTSVDFNHVYTGGWSIKGDTATSYEHEVGEICKAYNIPLIGWSDLTLCQHWTTICSDNVHPDTEAYKHMGEYITGKISQYFY